MLTMRAVSLAGAPAPAPAVGRRPASRPARLGRRASSTPTPPRDASCRVVQDPLSSMSSADFDDAFDARASGSIDLDQSFRREVVERDTAETLRRTIAQMGGAPIQDPREFVSTDEQRLVTAGLFASCAALCARGVAGVAAGEDGGDPLAYGGLLATAALAFWLSDAGVGIFHWSVDNYGSKKTPVMGGIIDAFQGHHKYPWTITKRQFANNIHTTCPATMCVSVPLLLAPGLGPNQCVFAGVFCSMVVLSQQFHCWSHTKKSELPALVLAAQDAGLIISRKAHGAHHKPPFKGNYCIVSGWWNEVFDGTGFFYALEKRIYDATGVAPRCWSEDEDFAVQEDAPEGWGDGIL
jgi:hypothetical protein